ncbi:SGNH/GDSL hydrolase family protein [Geopsychrobacter electrodiphilus]|uniref:SGNH/GDSL hydrolase family protein n=1 Tax=Geopsychrobacter electrodiphilus TaxID=225196 RepID=UPI00036913F8|nr:GDSL-type esterase/lipase family protein [Geopsychrobacter electrodiphilus]
MAIDDLKTTDNYTDLVARLNAKLYALAHGQTAGIIGADTYANLAAITSNANEVGYVGNDTNPLLIGNYIADGAGGWVQSSYDRVAVVETEADAIIPALSDISSLVAITSGKNLFNSLAVSSEYFINGTTGALAAHAGYYTSEFIRVIPSTNYITSPASAYRVGYYGKAQDFIGYADTVTAFTTASNVYYIKISALNATLATRQIELGSTATDYWEFSAITQLENKLSTNIKNTAILARGKNLVDTSVVTSGVVLDVATGATSSNASYFTTEYIKLYSSSSYRISGTPYGHAIYNSNMVYVSGALLNYGITTPSDSNGFVYIRISALNAQLNYMQIEAGTVATDYQKFHEITVSGNAILPDTIGDYKLKESYIIGTPSKNLFNKNDVNLNSFLLSTGGGAYYYANYFVSNYIPVNESTEYYPTVSAVNRISYYDKFGTFISQSNNVTGSITTPAKTTSLRLASSTASINSVQLELGSAATVYANYGAELSSSVLVSSGLKPPKIYTLDDAWKAWLNGDKFPIAFYGDSTTLGTGTTGVVAGALLGDATTPAGTDNTSPNAYSKILEALIIDATGNSTLKVYNAGFSGKTLSWGALSANMESEFAGTSDYSDVKMIGLGFGINDRVLYTTETLFKSGFKADLATAINWCYDHDIQPFLLTTQAVLACGVATTYVGTYPLRTSEAIETVANEIKREIAEKYGLEIVNLNAFTRDYLQYSSVLHSTLIPDKLHFGDVGHEFEAGAIFSEICPWCQTVESSVRIDYSTQVIRDAPADDLITLAGSLTNGFKLYASYTKGDALDLKIMTTWVFVTSKTPLTLTAYKGATGLTYAVVDGVTTVLSTGSTALGTLEIGLHKLEVFTGLSTAVDFQGFTLS